MALDALIIEQWIEYPIGMIVFLLRIFARLKVAGWRNLYWDDLLATLAMLFWTSEACTIHIMDMKGTYVGLNEEKVRVLSDEQLISISQGSKALFCAWLSYICLIWSLKGAVLFYYNRLTVGLREHRLVKGLAVVCVVTFFAMIFEILFQCRPIQRNWQIRPYAGDQCTLFTPRYYLLVFVNVLTDLGIMAFIPAPILWKAQIPFRRKLMVAILLFSGIFIVIAAIMRCVMSIRDIHSIGTSGAWAIRETFVSIFAVNAPAIKPLFSRNKTSNNTSKVMKSSRYGRNPNGDEVELRPRTSWSDKDMSSIKDVELGSSTSEVNISAPENENRLCINVTTAYTIGATYPSRVSSVVDLSNSKSQNHRKTRDGWSKIGSVGKGTTNTEVLAGNGTSHS
ncbi:hypothetical protein PVAG01_00164 [Phlyctema vagabunda]|uniref:Rhodopsin domain-containing protein n=1 Tax=Phlyctema vagabunda TaxID=108571 RepID=A0ABR4PTG0_9HELO